MLLKSRFIILFGLLSIFGLLIGCGRSEQEPQTNAPGSRLGDVVTVTRVGTPAPVATVPSPTPTPTREPPEAALIHYTVQYGDTLSGIAAFYGLTTEALRTFNGLTDADQLSAGQEITVPVNYYRQGPDTLLIPDSELVYGPTFVDFDVVQATSIYTGFFSTYTEQVNGGVLTAAQIVHKVAEQYSIGPRLLLALLELRGGWLTDPDPPASAQIAPLGYVGYGSREGLFFQLSQAANALSGGFYGWLWDDLWLVRMDNGEYIQYAPAINAGTAGVQRALAIGAADYEIWLAELSSVSGFPAVYRRLFGDPFDYAFEPLIPADLLVPNLALPWPEGETWYFTGGPHPAWGSEGAWAALDFATDERNLGCRTSRSWVTAAAPGNIIASEYGMVWQELDSDGFVGTGWVLLYLHLAEDGRVPAGLTVQAGDRLGHPSCEGGVSNASHLHFARRYNGVWIPAASAYWPLVLNGWRAVDAPQAYDGLLVKGPLTKEACECWEAINAISH